MYCSHCGAKLADDAKFCNECGAKLASPVSPPVPSASPATPPVSPAAPPVSAAAQTGFPQGSYPPPQGGYPQGQPGYPAPGAAQPYPYAGQAAPPKKKHTALIVILVLLALIPIAFILLFVMLRLRYEEPPLPVPEATVAEELEIETEPTTADPAEDLLQKLVGVWSADEGSMLIRVTREENGEYLFMVGYWYSEFFLKGYLQPPVTGDPAGEASVRLRFEGEGTPEAYSYFPPLDEAAEFDFAQLAEKRLRWKYDGQWYSFHYAGATLEEAQPPIG